MRDLIESFNKSYSKLHSRSSEFIVLVGDEMLFHRPSKLDRKLTPLSCGEYILRSAATVEQTFGGITTRLWDDPFEWTLPEKLSDVAKVIEYLDEVEVTRKKGFEFFNSDDDLKKQLPAPVEIKSLFELLLETLARAEHFQGRAFALFQTFSDDKLPRI